jgi:FkbM family methyltransferase
MKLLPGDIISDSIAFTGTYDLPLTRKLLRLAQDGGRLIDVGANLGYFSLLWSAVKITNRVTAFEASPRNFGLLQHNTEINQFADRIDIRPDAVGKENGEMEFDIGPADQTGWGGLSLEPTERSHRVPVVRLDDALRDVEQISLLKIDIEGADTWALIGAARLFRERRIKHVWWEQHKPRMRELGIRENEAVEFLREMGLNPVPQSDPRSDIASWYASRR